MLVSKKKSCIELFEPKTMSNIEYVDAVECTEFINIIVHNITSTT